MDFPLVAVLPPIFRLNGFLQLHFYDTNTIWFNQLASKWEAIIMGSPTLILFAEKYNRESDYTMRVDAAAPNQDEP